MGKKGFMIFIVSAAIFLLLVMFFNYNIDITRAEISARSYIQKIPKAINVMCVNQDTNQDGYCSCTVFMSNGDTKPIECGCNITVFSREIIGCRITQPKIQKY